MNGIYDRVLKEILDAQASAPDETFYLQPYTGTAIKRLREHAPSPESPVTMYASTTENLAFVSYTAQIVGWEDKTALSDSRRREITEALRKYQPGEGGHDLEEPGAGLYNASNRPGFPSINLLHIRQLERCDPPFSVSRLIKISDNLPLSTNRTRSGMWSYVHSLV